MNFSKLAIVAYCIFITAGTGLAVFSAVTAEPASAKAAKSCPHKSGHTVRQDPETGICYYKPVPKKKK